MEFMDSTIYRHEGTIDGNDNVKALDKTGTVQVKKI